MIPTPTLKTIVKAEVDKVLEDMEEKYTVEVMEDIATTKKEATHTITII